MSFFLRWLGVVGVFACVGLICWLATFLWPWGAVVIFLLLLSLFLAFMIGEA